MSTTLSSTSKEKADVLLLSGFLGSGKTTLLKRILSWQTDLSDTVVIVNEFGDVGIDGSLLDGSGSDVIELASGCICCSLAPDLMQSLRSVWERFQPRRIMIEASGVADPSAVVTVLQYPEMQRLMSLYKTITVLDADYWEAREAFGRLFFNQLEMADLILLNKIDLLEQALIPNFLNELHELMPNCRVLPTVYCRIDPETLWTKSAPKAFGLKPMEFYRTALPECNAGEPTEDCEAGPVDASQYITFSFEETRRLDEGRFKQFLRDLPWEVFRIKGPVQFKDKTALINFVGGKGEWTDWQGASQTRLAFIGWNIRSEEILEKLETCIAD